MLPFRVFSSEMSSTGALAATSVTLTECRDPHALVDVVVKHSVGFDLLHGYVVT